MEIGDPLGPLSLVGQVGRRERDHIRCLQSYTLAAFQAGHLIVKLDGLSVNRRPSDKNSFFLLNSIDLGC